MPKETSGNDAAPPLHAVHCLSNDASSSEEAIEIEPIEHRELLFEPTHHHGDRRGVLDGNVGEGDRKVPDDGV